MSSSIDPETGVITHTFNNESDERDFLVQYLTETEINQMAYGEVTMIALEHIKNRMESHSLEYLRKLAKTMYQ